ncbi:MAG TPA: hypothetical protein VHI93_02805 [Candidatus Thermoplasmatota archaeon]|nr:hypothetical protein [Candidatus Thermoplasmatota archaeon]
MRALPSLLAAAFLAAGCLQAVPAPEGTGDPSPREASNVGLRLAGTASRTAIGPGERADLSYTARNQGADAITHGVCERPYAFLLRSANGTTHSLQPRMVTCLGYSEDPFPRGATLAFNTTWNGTYAEGERLVPAPPGSYTFVATFTAWRGGQPVSVSLELPIRLLPG